VAALYTTFKATSSSVVQRLNFKEFLTVTKILLTAYQVSNLLKGTTENAGNSVAATN
jgi:hypothetical protein